ncbi:MAG: TonB-dependent receptor plug domain-containing protein, partial [Acidobacteria bacterium]|nr:TonB-dependent receptor plug domain-containing protein [Acidobacteriota bacterium]
MSSRILLILPVLLAAPAGAAGQEPGRVRVEVRAGADAVAGATVVVAGTTHVTDASGIAIAPAPAGQVQVTVVREGFVPVTVLVTVAPGEERVVRVALEPELTLEEEVTVVATTRTGRRIEDQPMRVEALDREEIEEKMLMTPGDIVMMLNEMGGMRVQTTSPSLGAASVRIQGMRGRYTRVLSDGLPLYGSQPGGLGLLQIPPMDLGQVEVIKGVASALHGAGAMGGVVNLLSRRPGDEAEREILLNQSTRGATDGVLWLSTPLSETWGMTLVGGGHRQSRADVDGDGWTDMARYGRGVVRPRLFWDDGEGRSLFLTAGATRETRSGGTEPGRVLPAGGEPYREALDTRRHDLGLLWQTLAGRSVVTARAAVGRQWHEHRFGETLERDRHDTSFA